MLRFVIDNEMNVKQVTSEFNYKNESQIVDRWDFKTLDDAIKIAESANLLNKNVSYLAVDRGLGVAPRFDVIEAPKVGDLVSRTLNGDYYPDGEIVKVTPGFKTIKTSTGSSYRLTKNGTWAMNRYWLLVKGHRSELNPHF